MMWRHPSFFKIPVLILVMLCGAAVGQITLAPYQGMHKPASAAASGTIVAQDDFNGATNGVSLESRTNWAKVHTYGDMTTWCSGSACSVMPSGSSAAEPVYKWTGNTFNNDQWVEAIVVKGSNTGDYWDRSGVAVRINGTYNAYTCTVSPGHLYINRLDGYDTQLASTAITVAGGETIRCEARGTEIKAIIGATTLTATDSNFASGTTGVATYNSSAWGRWGVDDWRAGNL